MNPMETDELKLYRGEDFVISRHIVIHQPSLGEICDYGEKDYYSMVYHLTATPPSLKMQLWDIGIDYTKITPFELFYTILYKLYPQEKTAILLGNLDLTQFHVMQKQSDRSILLYQIIDGEEVIFDEFTYLVLTDHLRQIHQLKIDETKPANDATKMILIEDAREDYEKNKNAEHRSQLKNLISSMVNSEGFKYDLSQVWDMKLYAFMDAVKRISKIQNARLLLQSGYSGYGINLKDINKKQLDWLGELD